jgi:hypothetical protein
MLIWTANIMSKKRRLTLIKFDKEGVITKFGYLDHNSHNVVHSGIVFMGDSLTDAAHLFIRNLIERSYPFEIDHGFSVNQIAIEYDFDDIKSLKFALKFDGGECGEMAISFPSLPHQILNSDNSDLIETLSDLALSVWDDFYDSLPKQQALDLFTLPDLEIEPKSVFAVAPKGHDPKTFDY